MSDRRYWLQTLGCPKNQVDSDKLAGLLSAGGYSPADGPAGADLVVVNTCAFVEAARQESIDTVLSLADVKRPHARLVVTGCLAERYGDELAEALPEVDLVAGFGVALTEGTGRATTAARPPGPVTPATPATRATPATAVTLNRRRPRGRADAAPSFDLLSLRRPPSSTPWAYVKVAEGCDRSCGFCAIPSFRGPQRSRPAADVVAEVESLVGDPAMPVKEVVLVAQDLASYGRDRTGEGRKAGGGQAPLFDLVRAVDERVARTRLLYLYPSSLTDGLIDLVVATGVPYFDLSLQHVSRPLLARMRRWGDGERFLERIAAIRAAAPDATLRSSFIVGYPGETEDDHDALLAFLRAAQLDWAGFFPFSREEATYAAGLDGQVAEPLAMERLRECAELQDAVTAARRDALVGQVLEVLVDGTGVGRSVHEAPEIDGVVKVPGHLPVGSMVEAVVTASLGTDLSAEPLTDRAAVAVR